MAKSKKVQFFLGKLFDSEKKKLLDTPFLLDAANLTTHAIVTGMTGSGKTGLCIALLEEAALQGVPAIVIDPKGDLTNLLLHFPDQKPQDFEPWLDADTARREGKDLSQLAAETAKNWKEGLASWGLGREQLVALQASTQFTVFTPGSGAGKPVNILASFEAPEVQWEANSEVLREKIASSVTALLGLVGFKDIDPLRSREHILLSNVIENAWSSGVSLNLSEIILRIQNPPFENLGAFPLEKFFPEKERIELALTLNNFLASPSFKTWLEGQSLDIPKLLTAADGRPRHSIFYIAHLSENERMFFVTLLFAAIEAWMRTQSGTSALRALVYFDEILGYLPPLSNPPSRTILLRMLKQARAFGVGLLLATQNPVDVDYKALSNAGTWMIGRLQTEQDKARLLDGLSSVGGTVDLKQIGELIAGLQKRVFLYHSVYQTQPQTFQSRWALNYLAGPLTRLQLQQLNQLQPEEAKAADAKTDLAKKTAAEEKPEKKISPTAIPDSFSTPPSVAGDFPEMFLPASLSLKDALQQHSLTTADAGKPETLLYKPALYAQAEIYYYARTYKVEHKNKLSSLITDLNSKFIKWQEYTWQSYSIEDLKNKAPAQARFAPIPSWLADEGQLKTWQKDFEESIYRDAVIQIHANEELKVYADPAVSAMEFLKMCESAAASTVEAEIKKINNAVDKKLASLSRKIARQRGEVDEQQDELNMRKMEEMGTHGELLLSFLMKRRKSISSSLTKRRLTEKAKQELEQEEKELEILETEYKEIESSKENEIKTVQERWDKTVNDVTTVPLSPQKKDIHVTYFGVVWLPYYIIEDGRKSHELPAYDQGN